MNRIVRLLVGLPGAGKSTYIAKNPEQAGCVISPDALLYEGIQYVWTPERCSAAWKKCFQRFGLALRRSEQNILWDATFMTEQSRSAIVGTAKGFGYEVEAIVVQTPLNTCIERQALRTPDRRVPRQTIEKMARQFQMPVAEEGFDRVLVIEANK